MSSKSKNECIHILKNNLISLEKFKDINFDKLKKEKYDYICLICGKAFISKLLNNHFNENNEHCLYINITNLSVFYLECKKSIIDSKGEYDQKEYYIQSPISEKYINIIENYIYGEYDSKNNDDTNDRSILTLKNIICSHIEKEDIINELNEKFINDYKTFVNLNLIDKSKDNYYCICLSCGEGYNNIYDIEEHFEFMKHILFFNFIDFTII
jgi:hypothetical protein